MKKSEAYKAAEAVVRSLGVTCANISIRQFICALVLLHEDDMLIDDITTRLHPAMVEVLPNATRKSVERNLRSARDAIVEKGDPERLKEVVGFCYRLHPSVGDVLDTIKYYMDSHGLWPEDEDE